MAYGLLVVAALLFAPVLSAASRVSVMLVIDGGSRLHQQAIDGLKVALRSDGRFEVGYRLVDISQAGSGEELVSSEADFAIAIGVKATGFVLSKNPAFPVLYTLVPEQTYQRFVDEARQGGMLTPDDDYVIFLGQKPSRIVRLARSVTGDDARIGLVSGEYAARRATALEAAARDMGLSVMVGQATAEDDAIKVMEQVLSETDVYIALYDTEILNRNNAKWLLYMAYRMKRPVIGFSSAYTRAGAVASVFSTPQQIGRQAGEWLLEMLEGNKPGRLQYPQYFTVTVNSSIMKTLHLPNLTAQQLQDRLLDEE